MFACVHSKSSAPKKKRTDNLFALQSCNLFRSSRSEISATLGKPEKRSINFTIASKIEIKAGRQSVVNCH